MKKQHINIKLLSRIICGDCKVINMEYKHVKHFFVIFMCLINTQLSTSIATHHVRAITTSDYSDKSPGKLSWELGLREATYQALRRERISQPNLKEELYSAPILGYQDSATPFGDIAVLARGQLYSTPHGYKFVQAPYRNDCDDCHNKPFRCEHQQCAPYRDQNSKSLLALWTVKRIRHRDPKLGHRYELQFTVSPMSPVASAEFVTRNGHFDYNIPGHVFIIKVKNPQTNSHNRNSYERKEEYKSDIKTSYWPHIGDTFNAPTHANLNEFTPNAINFNTGEYYTPSIKHHKPESDPNHTGYLIGISNDYKTPEVHHPSESPPLFIQRPFVGASKPTKFQTHERLQKEPIKHYHHHFYIPEISDVDVDTKNHHPFIQSTLTTQNKNQYITSLKPVLTSDSDQRYILTTSVVPSRLIIQPTQRVPITDHGYTVKNTFKYSDTTVPISVQPIIFRPSPEYHHVPTFSTTPHEQTIYKIITIPPATEPTPFNPSPFYVKYSDPDPTYSNNEPPTVAGYITQVYPTIVPSRTTYTTHTTPETSTYFTLQTEIPTTTPDNKNNNKYPDSINAQLPPPKSGTDTTIPYVSSTVISITTQQPQTTVKHSESETSITRVQVSRPTDQKETTTNAMKTTDLTTQTEEPITNVYTELIPTTPITNIMKPTNIFRTTESITTLEHKTETATIVTPTIADTTTEEITTTTKRYFARPNRPYLDDLDIFGNNQTSSTTVEPIETTTEKKTITNDEIFTTIGKVTPSPSTTETVTIKNTRIQKYLKYRNRTNTYNKYNRNYNSKRLRNRTQNLAKPETKPEDVETKTSQSLITSISFKVNKYNRRNYTDFSRPAIIPTDRSQRTRTYSVNRNQKEVNVFKTEAPETTSETTSETQNTKAFDDIAQTLVNHARAVTYLDNKATTPINSHK